MPYRSTPWLPDLVIKVCRFCRQPVSGHDKDPWDDCEVKRRLTNETDPKRRLNIKREALWRKLQGWKYG